MKTLYDNNGTPFNLLQENDVEGKGIAGNVGYLRFSNGIQICWGKAIAKAGERTGRFTFAKPFSMNPAIIATHSWSMSSRGQITSANTTLTYSNICIYDDDSSMTNDRVCECLAIGKWK